VAKGWKYPQYRKLRRLGQHVFALPAQAGTPMVPALAAASTTTNPQTTGQPQWPSFPATTNGNGYHGDGTAWWDEL
jgi:hypothetical protein